MQLLNYSICNFNILSSALDTILVTYFLMIMIIKIGLKKEKESDDTTLEQD